jgi:hypothetical protein
VDPFGCVVSFTESGGGIYHAAVKDILRRCAEKPWAVVSLWWGLGPALRDHHQATCDLPTV